MATRQVVVMQGLPGAGKSTIARKLKHEFISENQECHIFSSDSFHMENGVYTYKQERAAKAHGRCLHMYARFLMANIPDTLDPHRLLIIDNTNTTVAEIAPYIALAHAFDWRAHVLRVSCDVETAVVRNTHGVPMSTLIKMQANIWQFNPPAWWEIQVALQPPPNND